MAIDWLSSKRKLMQSGQAWLRMVWDGIVGAWDRSKSSQSLVVQHELSLIVARHMAIHGWVEEPWNDADSDNLDSVTVASSIHAFGRWNVDEVGLSDFGAEELSGILLEAKAYRQV